MSTINLGNGVIGQVANQGNSIVSDFNTTSQTLAVGQPASNIVTLVTPLIMRDGFE